MYTLDELDNLIELYSSSNIRTMSGINKKVYKKSLIAITINIFSGTHVTFGQSQNLNIINNILLRKYNKEEMKKLHDEISNIVDSTLKKSNFRAPFDEDFTNECIEFMRKRLSQLKEDNISLFQARELSKIIDIKKYFSIESMSEFIWIEFDLIRGLIPTFPEMIIFNDLKVFWNKYIDTIEHISSEQAKVAFKNNPLKYLGYEKNREKHYELGTLYRSLIFLAVGYVESYLYNLFCTIRETDIYGKNKVSTIINKDMVQDTQIIEDVLLVIFPKMAGEISELYKKYKIILNHRDRYVHVSPLIDKSNNSSHLKPVLDINKDRIAEFLQTSIDLVKKLIGAYLKNFNFYFGGIMMI